jgi:hypothetical protein
MRVLSALQKIEFLFNDSRSPTLALIGPLFFFSLSSERERAMRYGHKIENLFPSPLRCADEIDESSERFTRHLLLLRSLLIYALHLLNFHFLPIFFHSRHSTESRVLTRTRKIINVQDDGFYDRVIISPLFLFHSLGYAGVQ